MFSSYYDGVNALSNAGYTATRKKGSAKGPIIPPTRPNLKTAAVAPSAGLQAA